MSATLSSRDVNKSSDVSQDAAERATSFCQANKTRQDTRRIQSARAHLHHLIYRAFLSTQKKKEWKRNRTTWADNKRRASSCAAKLFRPWMDEPNTPKWRRPPASKNSSYIYRKRNPAGFSVGSRLSFILLFIAKIYIEKMCAIKWSAKWRDDYLVDNLAHPHEMTRWYSLIHLSLKINQSQSIYRLLCQFSNGSINRPSRCQPKTIR